MTENDIHHCAEAVGSSDARTDASAWHAGTPSSVGLCGAAPAPAAAHRGLPLTSAVAQQGPVGCWGMYKDWQDQTLDFFASSPVFFSIEFTLKLLLKKMKKERVGS